MSFKVVFVMPDGSRKEASAEDGDTLVQAAYRAGVTIQQTCAGVPSCTDCRVKVLEGLENLKPVEGPEMRLMGNISFITKERLSCQAGIGGNCVVQVPPPRDKKTRK